MSGLIIPGNMKLGGAVVTLSLHQKQLDAGINTAKGKILRFTKWVWNHRRGILIGGGLATAGGTAAGMMANDAMSVWTETELALNRLKILTDGMKGDAGEFALKLGKDMNVSSKAAVDLYARFFAMGRGLEMAQEEPISFRRNSRSLPTNSQHCTPSISPRRQTAWFRPCQEAPK